MTSDLEDVVSGPHVGEVHPLAVDVVAVRIPAAHADALVAHVIAGEAFGQACVRTRRCLTSSSLTLSQSKHNTITALLFCRVCISLQIHATSEISIFINFLLGFEIYL